MANALQRYYTECAARNHRAVLLWHAEDTPSTELILSLLDDLKTLSVHQGMNYRRFLGTEQRAVFFDLRQEFHADAWVALTGTLVGRGLCIVRVNQAALERPSFAHVLSWLPASALFHCHQDQELLDFLTQWQAPQRQLTYSPTPRQQTLLDALQTLKGHSAFLIDAPRGRGKTATLAHWLAQLPEQAKVWLSAPSKEQAEVCLDARPSCQFLPPDQLQHQLAKAQQDDYLVIDEAATLPTQALRSILSFPGALILATTTEGYEYAGRGFRLKFEAELRKRFAYYRIFTLKEPVRWASEDPLEEANNTAFTLYSQREGPAPIANPDGALTYAVTHARTLSIQTRIRVFELLTDAHYQTSPNDFRLLLDDTAQHLILLKNGMDVIGVAWLAEEGPLIQDLLDDITRGIRRPPGNLLPQTYCYYLKAPELGILRHGRIVRIAIHQDCRRVGLGSALLSQTISWAMQQNYDSLGTSFGADIPLLNFWQQNGWFPVRLGHKADPASGHASVLFVQPLSTRSQPALRRLASLFLSEVSFRAWCGMIDNDLAANIGQHSGFRSLPESELESRWHLLGRFFMRQQLNFDDYRPWLAAAIQCEWLPPMDTYERHLLQQAAYLSLDLSQVAEAEGFTGKKALLNALREICTRLHQSV
ncbi:MAG: tRNA(Met) cytidine acetyltransferase [Idiomarina sp.]|nr:tRNA(Met) cytidine acetyltransferase [Idiomarina sp.]